MPLERLFGTLTPGMAFGETALLLMNEPKHKFYNAIALTEAYYL
jgi:CRP-like cAMP-binding protein